MDYKTNVLSVDVNTTEQFLPEFENMRFGILDANRALFNYSEYFKLKGIPPVDYKAFMRANSHYINSIVSGTELRTSELFYQNPNGDILVAAELSLLFLAYIDSDLCKYFNGLLVSVISDGVAYSNGFAYGLAEERIPTNILKKIIKDRGE